MQTPNASSDDHDLKTGTTIGVLSTLGMVVVGMLGRGDAVRPADDGDSSLRDPGENNVVPRTSSSYERGMDASGLSTAGNNHPNITELKSLSPEAASTEIETGHSGGVSVAVARGMTDAELRENEAMQRAIETSKAKNSLSTIPPGDHRKISTDDDGKMPATDPVVSESKAEAAASAP